MKPVSLSRFRAGLITDYVASGWRFVADRDHLSQAQVIQRPALVTDRRRDLVQQGQVSGREIVET